jgi:hypothetical protein
MKHPKNCKFFKKIKTNHPFPVAACAIKKSGRKSGFTPLAYILALPRPEGRVTCETKLCHT